MSNVAIKVEGLGKKYKIGHQVEGDLRNSLVSKMKGMFGKTSTTTEDFWALKDVSFEVKQGEAVGIIGRNGAGKSTLLKVLSRITDPTSGRYEMNGRVSSLLEVGTGFHQDLTGRENIYLNGTILGMKRQEIKNKFDEIIAFSGVERFLDTPVKHYSSGMKVRLAFSVAAHLEPEILIIDEVLAVGDAEFQKKCLGKMDEVSKNEGRTVLFVSHNLTAVSQLCQKGILLRDGNLIEMGETGSVIHSYVSYKNHLRKNVGLSNLDLRTGTGSFKVDAVRLLNEKEEPISIARTGSEIIFEISFDRKIKKDEGSFRIDFAIDTEQDARVGWFSSDVVRDKLLTDFQTLYLRIPKFVLGSGTYSLTYFSTLNGDVVDYIHQAFLFEVEEGDFFGTGKSVPKSQTFIYTDHQIYSK